MKSRTLNSLTTLGSRSSLKIVALKVVSVIARAGAVPQHGADTDTIHLLQAAGFTGLKSLDDKRIAGMSNAHTQIVLEYEQNVGSQSGFRLLNRHDDGREDIAIDTGHTIYIGEAPGLDGMIEIAGVGNEIKDITLKCLPTIPVASPSPVEIESAPIVPPEPEPPELEVMFILARVDECIAFQPSVDAPQFSGQVRKEFNKEALQDLAESLKSEGQLTPILVCPYKGPLENIKWEIIAGERRWRAAKIAGLPTLMAIVRKPADKRAQHRTSIIENLHRVPNNFLELSIAFQEQMAAGATRENLMKEYGMSRSTLGNILGLNGLSPSLYMRLSESTPKEDRMSLVEASALSKLQREEQLNIWEQARKEPTRSLVVKAIHTLGKPFRIYKNKRVKYEEPSTIGRGIERILNNFRSLSMDLAAITSEEWQKYGKLYGSSRLQSDMQTLIETEQILLGTRNRMSRAKASLTLGAVSPKRAAVVAA